MFNRAHNDRSLFAKVIAGKFLTLALKPRMGVHVWMCASVHVFVLVLLVFSFPYQNIRFYLFRCDVNSLHRQSNNTKFSVSTTYVGIETIPKHRHKHEPTNNRKKKRFVFFVHLSCGTFYGKILGAKYGKKHKQAIVDVLW